MKINNNSGGRDTVRKISQAEDFIMKYVMELFSGDALKFFGVDKKVVSIERTELGHITLQRNRDDFLMTTEDNWLIHLEFQVTRRKENLPRFMISDAMLYYNTHKRVMTIVVYSGDIKKTGTTLDAGAIKYSVKALYMSDLDGDRTHEELRAKVESGKPLTKQDLISIVFLPLMRSEATRTEQVKKSLKLTNQLPESDEQMQIQAMLILMGEKFLNRDEFEKLKGELSMLKMVKWLVDEGRKEGLDEGDKKAKLLIAKKLILQNMPTGFVTELTELDTATVEGLRTE
jgi:hypothetical protein